MQLFLIDLDGTTYLDNKLIDGAKTAIDKIINSGRKLCFLTNNSSKSQSDYVNKLNNMGISCLNNEVYTSGNSCINFILSNYPNKSVYLVGTDKLAKQFIDNNVKLVADNADIVVISYDTSLSYDKLVTATRLISLGAEYIVTHADINCPHPQVYVPDVGSFIKLIEASTGKLPKYNCGKPHGIMGANISSLFHLSADCIAMIGDRLTTDMQFAINNGFTSILVLSGETTVKAYNESNIKVDYVLNSIADIVKFI